MDLHLFRTLKVPVVVNLCFSLSEKRTRQSYERMYLVFCRMSNGEYFEKEFNSLG